MTLLEANAMPVVYRVGGGIPLMIKLPYADDNSTWLRGDNPSETRLEQAI